MNPRVYIAGGLTGIEPGLREFYEDIAMACQEAGLEPYLPHQHTDPLKHPGHSPEGVYRRNTELVAGSGLVIAYLGAPSLGVGTELEIARSAGVEVVALLEKNRQVSRMATGNPVIKKMIAFSSKEGALKALKAWLRVYCNR